ncbi:MAG: hypothetical protein QW638_04825 [Candidatus Bathyarchaeia archaeon]|nr:hypothetical protein [Candidatus Bathyarchaeota archaeon]
MEKKGFWDRLQTIDHRVLYAAVIVVIIVPLLRPLGLPITVTDATLKAYRAVDEYTKPGSVVVIAFEFIAGNWPEMGPIAVAMTQHVFNKPDVKVIILAMGRDEGPILAERTLRYVDKKGKEYGKDYVNLGFFAGGEAAMAAFARDIMGLVKRDYYGTPIENLPVMSGLKSLSDIDLFICLWSGTPGWVEYLRQWQTPYGIACVGGTLGVVGPGAQPYVAAGQLKGLVVGLRGGGEYEKLINKPGEATAGLDAISTTHILIFACVILGNIGYLATKGVKRRRG